eukprot:528163-Rhodomonas_salina.1
MALENNKVVWPAAPSDPFRLLGFRQGNTTYGGELVSHSEECTRVFILRAAPPQLNGEATSDAIKRRQCVVVSFSSGLVAMHDGESGKEVWKDSMDAANGTMPVAYVLSPEQEEDEAEDEEAEENAGLVIRVGCGQAGGGLMLMDLCVNVESDEPVETLRASTFEGVCNANTTAVGRVWVGGEDGGTEA